jgi:uncharacterized phage-associated protein
MNDLAEHLDISKEIDMAYPAQAVANFFIEKSIEDKTEDLNIMKLIKTVFIAHGFYLALQDKPLINEFVQAWKYGPVIDSVYHEFKGLGHKSIKFLAASEIGEDANGVVFAKSYYQIPDSDIETKEFLKNIWEICKNHSGIELSNWTHKEGSPWRQIWESKDRVKINPQIPEELIKTYFKGLLKDGAQSATS